MRRKGPGGSEVSTHPERVLGSVEHAHFLLSIQKFLLEWTKAQPSSGSGSRNDGGRCDFYVEKRLFGRASRMLFGSLVYQASSLLGTSLSLPSLSALDSRSLCSTCFLNLSCGGGTDTGESPSRLAARRSDRR